MARTPAEGRSWIRAFIRNTLLCIIPVTILWVIAAPVYNRLLLSWASGVLHVFEHPNVTALLPKDSQDAFIQRLDFPPAKSLVYAFRITDIHFPLILLVSLFLGVPRISWRERLSNLLIAFFATAFFEVILVVLIVKSCYANQLGEWSLAHYGDVARNVYGMGKHLFDLPLKLGLPFLLWSTFYLSALLTAIREREKTPS
jgi:hypothetical protein